MDIDLNDLGATDYVLAAVLALVFFLQWRRDVKNPSQAASFSVVSDSAAGMGSTMAAAIAAMEMAQKAADANIECKETVAALVAYNRTLVAQLVTNGIVPVELPADLQ